MNPEGATKRTLSSPPGCVHCGLPVAAGRHTGANESYCCFGCRFAALVLGSQQGARSPLSVHTIRLGTGIFLTLNLMVFNWIFYSGEAFGMAAQRGQGYAQIKELFAYLQLLLATGVVALVGVPLLADALEGSRLVRRRGGRWHFSPHIETNLLIFIAVFSAYLISTLHVFKGSGPLYFDTATGVLVLVTLGNLLEAAARRRAVSSTSMMDGLPATVQVARGKNHLELSPDALKVGDLIRVRPGELIAVDGTVHSGCSHLDSRRLTGESQPRSVGPKDSVLAGSAALDGELWVKAVKTGADRVLAQMEILLETSRRERPPLAKLTDRIAVVFVPAVVAVAVAAFAWWSLAANAQQGLLAALSVLLISCPCALGLAAPLAAWSALRRAADQGILFGSCAALQRAAGIQKVFFDKTGTLTDARLIVEEVFSAKTIRKEEAIALAAGVESASLHPIGKAILRLAKTLKIVPARAEGFRLLPGVGVEARIQGRLLRLGGPRLAEQLQALGPPFDQLSRRQGETPIFLTDTHAVLAVFLLSESLRPEAREAVCQLQDEGIAVGILTGDLSLPAARIAALLQVSAHDSLLSGDKVRLLEAARRKSPGVAMVGDGLNDAATLAAADLGISVATATDITRDVADVNLQQNSLLGVPAALRLSRHTIRRLRLTLCWAFGYNLVGVGLAAAGLLTPLFSASAMIVSSLLIIWLAGGAGGCEEPPSLIQTQPALEAEMLSPPPVGQERAV